MKVKIIKSNYSEPDSIIGKTFNARTYGSDAIILITNEELLKQGASPAYASNEADYDWAFSADNYEVVED